MLTKTKLSLTALALVLATPLMAQEPSGDTVVATVGGKDITLAQMLVLREKLPPQYQSLPDDALYQGILEQLIQQEALAQSVEGEITPKDEIAMNLERQSYLAGKALEQVAAAAVTDEALQAAYDARYAEAAPTTEYNASHILVDSEEKAKDLKTQIDGGADFAKLATENSSDPGSAQNGGSLGWFGAGMMVKPFEDAVATLEPGGVSAPIQTQFGWHIVKLNETREAEKPTLDAVRDELSAEIQQAAVTEHLAKITEGANVSRSEETIDPSVLRNDSLVAE
ncbi:peptidylprolyl isomerase [Cereibacter sp. SYSU M97828]|nr:peptidylprolyl isomerase [Cereibacter flavus]